MMTWLTYTVLLKEYATCCFPDLMTDTDNMASLSDHNSEVVHQLNNVCNINTKFLVNG